MQKSILLRTAKKFLLLFSFYAAISVSVQGATFTPLPPELTAMSAQAFQSLYRMDYKTAKHYFERMTRHDPKHPAGYIYAGTTLWLEQLAGLRRMQTQLYNRNDAFFRQEMDTMDPALEKRFYATVEKGIIRAQMRLRKNPKDLTGLYYLGVGYGTIAGYEGTVKRAFLSALKHGSEAAEVHRKLLTQDPDFADACLTPGLYNYIVGTLPMTAKVLMLVEGISGSKEEGLRQLRRAYQHGRLARDEAAALLVVIYDREKKYADALQLLRALTEKYPQNPLFRFETATMLTKTGKFTESRKIYEKLLNDRLAREYFLDYLHFQYAELLFSTGSWYNAYTHYLNARRVMQKTPVGLITMSHLRAGQCLNAMGRHEDAAREYGFVLKQPEIQGSKALARQYLKTPYRLIPVPAKR